MTLVPAVADLKGEEALTLYHKTPYKIHVLEKFLGTPTVTDVGSFKLLYQTPG